MARLKKKNFDHETFFENMRLTLQVKGYLEMKYYLSFIYMNTSKNLWRNHDNTISKLFLSFNNNGGF